MGPRVDGPRTSANPMSYAAWKTGQCIFCGRALRVRAAIGGPGGEIEHERPMCEDYKTMVTEVVPSLEHLKKPD